MLVKEKRNLRFNLTASKSEKEYVASQAEKLDVSVSEFVRDLIESHKKKNRDSQLRSAAEKLMGDYKNDKELTAFTNIDGDPFL